MIRFASPLPQRPALVLALLAGLAPGVWAQTGSNVSLEHVPADMIESTRAEPARPIDLGQEDFAAADAAGATVASSPASGAATRAAQAARQRSGERVGRTRRPPPSAAQARAGVERAVFDRQPVLVPLPVGRERLITLPAPAALHVPTDMAKVARIETIDRTIYVTALVPFTTIRIVAELIDSGQQIPMDLVADERSAGAVAELEVFVVEPAGRGGGGSGGALAAAEGGDPDASAVEQPAADMVELTRHAARQLYAPRRLAWTRPGVQQVAVDTQPIDGLVRGALVETAPVGQWRSGQLYVTAVRVTNRSQRSLEIPLEDIRGRWLAATAQHGRIGPAGSSTDTTAIYLVCDRAFAACLR